MEIKVCGMRDPENIRELLNKVQPDWMGLIFYSKSSRFVSEQSVSQIAGFPVKKVGVFVNEEVDQILTKIREFDLSAIQLHGQESPQFVESLSKNTSAEIWKVISVENQIDWQSFKGYLPYVSKFLFDTATSTHGGSGKKFDWKVLETYPFNKGFLLSGGLDGESAEEVLALGVKVPQLEGVDLNSKFEDAPGFKNIEKLVRFKKRLLQK